MQDTEDLNDLRLVAWIAETGSLAGAAKRMGVNHATVFRRLNQLESRLGVRLFERGGGRYHTTAAGEELAHTGAAMNNAATQALLRVAGRDLRPSGLVRITTTDSVALALLQLILLQCRLQYPQITLTLEVDNRSANLSKRDADIAIRPTSQPPDYLIGKQIAPLYFCVYGARQYLAATPFRQPSEHQWIALDDTFNGHRTLRWLENFKPLGEVGYRTSSFGFVREACSNGLGLAVLPCMLGDSLSTLQRVGDPIGECTSALWLLIHPDLRSTTRIKVIFELLQRELGKAMQRFAP